MDSREDKALLVSGNTFVVLNLVLNIVDGVRSFFLEGVSLPGEGLDGDLHLWSSSNVVSSARLGSGSPRR